MKNLLNKLIAGWNKFFFEPISPASLGLFRIVFGFVIFLSNLGRYPVRDIFYSDEGIIKYHTMDQFFPPHPFFYFRWLPNSEPGLKYFFIALLVVTVLFTIGLFTRISTILLFFGIMCLSNRNFFVDNAGDHLLRINLFFLMFSHCGDAYSLDRWRTKKALTPKPPWAQRMLQLQLAYLYLDTVYLKTQGELWRNGLAMYYAFDYIELTRFEFKYFFYYLWQIKLDTYAVLAAETSMFSLIWFRKLRYWVLAVGFFLHLGINLTMQFPVFQYVMMASLINFVYPEDTERFIKSTISFFKSYLTPHAVTKSTSFQ